MTSARVELVLVPGELVEGGLGPTSSVLQLGGWNEVVSCFGEREAASARSAGGHEADRSVNLTVWNAALNSARLSPENGPEGETNLTCSSTHRESALRLARPTGRRPAPSGQSARLADLAPGTLEGLRRQLDLL